MSGNLFTSTCLINRGISRSAICSTFYLTMKKTIKYTCFFANPTKSDTQLRNANSGVSHIEWSQGRRVVRMPQVPQPCSKTLSSWSLTEKKIESSDDVDAIGGGTGGPHGPSPPLLFLGSLAPHFLLSNFA